MTERLRQSFYSRRDALWCARSLLGAMLVSQFDGERTSGMITETEAYTGPCDRASHAYHNRRTRRTETMYRCGGTAYVYLCYGIHHLFNVVVGPVDWPAAVLIRSIQPVDGIERMLDRTNKKKKTVTLANGPGKLTRSLGITTADDQTDLVHGDMIWIEAAERPIKREDILASPRIGVDYAGVDALLPYRFTVKDSPFISK